MTKPKKINTAMNLENKDIRSIETSNPRQEPVAFPSEGDGETEASRTVRERPVAGMPHGFCRPMFVMTGVAICMGLASCIVPYDSHGSGYTTTYRPGYSVTSLPGGYRSEVISGSTYYYHDGYYYRRGSRGYVVVDAPRSSRYYEDYNRRQRSYQPSRDYWGTSNRRDQRYDRDEVITRLPDGYREVKHRGKTYYEAGDRYYCRQGDRYVITSRPY